MRKDVSNQPETGKHLEFGKHLELYEDAGYALN